MPCSSSSSPIRRDVHVGLRVGRLERGLRWAADAAQGRMRAHDELLRAYHRTGVRYHAPRCVDGPLADVRGATHRQQARQACQIQLGEGRPSLSGAPRRIARSWAATPVRLCWLRTSLSAVRPRVIEIKPHTTHAELRTQIAQRRCSWPPMWWVRAFPAACHATRRHRSAGLRRGAGEAAHGHACGLTEGGRGGRTGGGGRCTTGRRRRRATPGRPRRSAGPPLPTECRRSRPPRGQRAAVVVRQRRGKGAGIEGDAGGGAAVGRARRRSRPAAARPWRWRWCLAGLAEHGGARRAQRRRRRGRRRCWGRRRSRWWCRRRRRHLYINLHAQKPRQPGLHLAGVRRAAGVDGGGGGDADEGLGARGVRREEGGGPVGGGLGGGAGSSGCSSRTRMPTRRQTVLGPGHPAAASRPGALQGTKRCGRRARCRRILCLDRHRAGAGVIRLVSDASDLRRRREVVAQPDGAVGVGRLPRWARSAACR